MTTHKAEFWIAGALDQLQNEGHFEQQGGPILTVSQRAAWDQLDASGFRPSEHAVNIVLRQRVKSNDFHKLRRLVITFITDEGRARMRGQL